MTAERDVVEGTPFGRYRLLDLLGRGGMGEVWRAYDTVTDRIVAIKLLPKHLSQDADYQRRFRKEAHAATRLVNPHVIPIHTHGDMDGRLYLDMRLIEGRNLEDLIADGPLGPMRAVNIVEQLADALQAAHGIGLIHRDVKPSNVLIAANDFVYLIDFGIATIVGETRATGTGNMIGSYHYMAPERLSGNEAGVQSDVYSLACVLFECLTGTRPFPGDSLESQVGGHMMTAPPRPTTVEPTVPAAFDAVIAVGLAKDPRARYPSATALAHAARAAIEPPAASPAIQHGHPPERRTASPPLPVDAASAPTQYRPLSSSTPIAANGGRRKHLLIVGAGALAIVAAVVIVLGYLVIQRDDDIPVAAPTSSSVAKPTSSTPDGADALSRVEVGECLTWPERNPDAAEIVPCGDEHRFEVAEALDLSASPGDEFGPNAAPPSAQRVQQISQERCPAAARQYLGSKYDPNSRFTVSLLWSGDEAWKQEGERRMLCGLQLPGPDNLQLGFAGRVADLDQSRVWPSGTCLGIDLNTNQPNSIPVDCAAPHAMEITGSVNVGQRFPAGFPSETEQDAFVKDSCTKLTDAYLAPVQLRATTLTLIYSTIAQPSWTAGSRQVSCSVGATLGDGGWATLLNRAKGPLLINGQPPAP